MKRMLISSLCITISLLLASTICSADEREEPQHRVEKLRHAAGQLAEQGLHDHAERLEREAQELSRDLNARRQMETPRPGHPQLIEEHERALGELRREGERLRDIGAPEAHRAEIEEQIQNVERDLDRLRAEHPGVGGVHRVEHLRMAAEHLEQADMPDMAHQLRRRAEALQRRGEHHQGHHTEQHPDHAPHREHEERELAERLADQVRELHREMSKLREELNELRSHVFGR
ncbi:hypothetical protein SH139x_003299 [Planctomycetaceae bacterium SH139]